MTSGDADDPIWLGLSGAALAFGFATIVGLITEIVSGSIFQSLVLALLSSVAALLFEAKVTEHRLPDGVRELAEGIARSPQLRRPLASILDSFASARRDQVAAPVLEKAEADLAAMAQQWKLLPANRLETPFNDNRIRVAQTRRAVREILAVACDDIDLRYWSEETSESYWGAQLDFQRRRGGKVRRIFAFRELTPQISAAMGRHHDHGVDVWAVNSGELARAGLDVVNLVVWDAACASETKIVTRSAGTAGPTDTIYHFAGSDIRRLTDYWHAVRVHARPFAPPGPPPALPPGPG
jgi:hypothetical protein